MVAICELAEEKRKRIHDIQRGFRITYPQGDEILSRFEDLISSRRQGPAQVIALIGEPNTGKTELLEAFHQRHYSKPDPNAPRTTLPILKLYAPPEATLEAFYGDILCQLFLPAQLHRSERLPQMRARLVVALKSLNTKMLLVDDAHSLLVDPRSRAHILADIADFAHQLQMPIVLAGTSDLASAIKAHPLLSASINQIRLRSWEPGADLEALLKEVELQLPIAEESELAALCIQEQVVRMTLGRLGEILDVIKLAAEAAVKSGAERITLESLASLPFRQPFPEPPEISEQAEPMARRSSTTRIEDAGQIIPHARKHLANEGAPSSSAGKRVISKKALWAEPDWRALIDGGVDPKAAAYLFVVYDSIRAAPASELEIDDYYAAVTALKTISGTVRTEADALAMRDLHKDRLRAQGREDAFFCVGRGSRTRRSAFAFTARQKMLAQHMVRLGWPDKTAASRMRWFPVEVPDRGWRLCTAEGNKYWYNPKDPVFALFEEAADAAVSKNAVEEKVPKRAFDALRVRCGPDWRQSRPVTPEQLMAEFGVTAIQWGNWITQAERQEWLDALFDAMADLADLLQFPRRWIGGKRLAIAIGARGASKALAHFEPQYQVINLTKEGGKGSFAHEWAHHFDFRLGDSLRKDSGNPELNPEMLSIWLDQAVDHCVNGHQDAVLPVRLDDAVTDFRYRRIFNEDTTARPIYAAFYNIVRAIGASSAMTYRGPDADVSNFAKAGWHINQIARSGQYWTKPEELFARAFEAHVEDRLTQAGRESPWLVMGTRDQDYPGADPTRIPYPTGQERSVIGEKVASLIQSVSETYAQSKRPEHRGALNAR